MDRRSFLTSVASMAGGAALAPRRAFAQPIVNRVVVIGAGIIGACIARELAKRGCDVVVIDKGLPASEASGNTFAWINAAYTNRPASYLSLRQQSLAEYRRLAEDVSFPIRWGGSLEWFQDTENERRLAADIAAFSAIPGAATTMIDAAAAAELEPNLDVGGQWRIAHSTNDGAIDAPAATQAIFDSALALGAQGVLLADVRSIQQRRRNVRVRTTGGNFEADVVVIAAGTGSQRLARMVDINIDTATRAHAGGYRHHRAVASLNQHGALPAASTHPPAAGWPLRDRRESRSSVNRRSHRRPAGPTHGVSRRRPRIGARAARPVPSDGLRFRIVRREAHRCRHRLAADAARRPADCRTKRVYAQRVYFATMHSGVTLAPIIGRYAATEILDGARLPALDDFRPDRFAA